MKRKSAISFSVMNEITGDKQLFEFIRSANISQTPSLKELLSNYQSDTITISDVLTKLRQHKDRLLLIDARSQAEFEDSEIPGAENFPVLTNTERHNVGLIYKKYSQAAALWLALKYAEPKIRDLDKFLSSQSAAEREIIVYCWRGGGRSGYISKMISDLGYKVSILKGGHKSFRRYVNGYFSRKIFPSGLIELTGMTGSGKTMLLKEAGKSIPIIDLENSALHYSSLLGRIPYDIQSIPKVKSQAAFENRIFADITLNMMEGIEEAEVYLIESESKKVGDFIIPEMLFNSMLTAPVIRVDSSIEHRVKRLNRDYFGENNEGIEPMMKIMKEKKTFFRQQLSSSTYEELIANLERCETGKFTEIMLIKYYDVKYKDKGKIPVAVVNADNAGEALIEISETYRKIKQTRKNASPGSA
jgi:tRNA 2-selenouridine synthase